MLVVFLMGLRNFCRLKNRFWLYLTNHRGLADILLGGQHRKWLRIRCRLRTNRGWLGRSDRLWGKCRACRNRWRTHLHAAVLHWRAVIRKHWPRIWRGWRATRTNDIKKLRTGRARRWPLRIIRLHSLPLLHVAYDTRLR